MGSSTPTLELPLAGRWIFEKFYPDKCEDLT